jgi:photosystem II stability/assembly factor-like uncharacterized protein
VFGQVYNDHPERGVFKSTDGGQTFRKTLYRDEKTAGVDISIDPKNPNVIYAGLWEAFRSPWGCRAAALAAASSSPPTAGTPGRRSRRTPGLPEGLWGKVGVSVSPADGNRVYAIIENEKGGLFVSDDAGASWKLVNENRNLRQRAFYYTRVVADTKDKDTVYVLNVQFFKSTDGGKTTTTIRVPHGDNHDLWISATDNQRMMQSNDGGGNVSVNGGETWTGQDFPTGQFYNVFTTKHVPYHVCGAQQDNSTACVGSQARPGGRGQPAAHLLRGRRRRERLHRAGSQRPERVLRRQLRRLPQPARSRDRPAARGEHLPEQPDGPLVDRHQGAVPVDVPDRLLAGGRQDPLRLVAAPVAHHQRRPELGEDQPQPDALGPEDAAGLGRARSPRTRPASRPTRSSSPSPRRGRTATRIWTGSDDGWVHVTRDGGKNWERVTPPDLPDFTRISLIEASPHQNGVAYLAGNRYQLGDRGRTSTRRPTSASRGRRS